VAGFSLWPRLVSRLPRRVGGVPTGPLVSFSGRRDGSGWSAGREGLQPTAAHRVDDQGRTTCRCEASVAGFRSWALPR
jgi:hypothetical protein